MKRLFIALALAAGLTVGAVTPAGAAPDTSATPAAPAHVPLRTIDVCEYLRVSYGLAGYVVDRYDSLMVHYGGYHVYNCAARKIGSSQSTYSICYQYIYETKQSNIWGTRPRYQCS